MLWTVAVIADSAETFYETLVRRLSADEKDALWRDYIRFGELFGMPRDGGTRDATRASATTGRGCGPAASCT